MGQGPAVSLIVSTILVIALIGTFQYYNSWFNETPMKTVLCGYIGSWLFIFCLTATSNMEMIIFGSEFQAKFFPEVLFCLSTAVFACSSVHRVCATSCILFSIAGLYFINKISQKTYNSIVVAVEGSLKKSGGSRKNKQF